jgi:hypothetical protein
VAVRPVKREKEMASVNKVIIVGNLGRDPEMRYTPSGDAIANIAVATSYRSKDRTTGEQKELVEWRSRISSRSRRLPTTSLLDTRPIHALSSYTRRLLISGTKRSSR